MYVTAIPVSALERCSIDTWNTKGVLGKRGYQRKPDENRVRNIAKYFERPTSIMPAAGLLNVREKGLIKFKKGILTIPDNAEVWVVDMQHRLKGLCAAAQNGVLKDADFSYPVVITEGLSHLDEAAQFYVINTKAKKMDVSLTRRLLIENNVVSEIADAQAWEIAAVHATIEINNKQDSPWRGAILPPNEEKLTTHVATEKSFVTSLRPYFVGGKHKQPKRVARRLANFWTAIQHNLPDAFKEPRRYLIQKTPGMFVFNFFIGPRFLHKYKDKEFVDKLQGLQVLGAKFWLRSNKNGAHGYGTGMGTYADLAADVMKHLPL